MKKFILVLLLSFHFVFSNAQTSVYHPFPTGNALWREGTGGYQCSCCAEYQYSIINDTLLDGLVYHNFKQYGERYLEDMTGYCNYLWYGGLINEYSGAFREDTINKKVYFRKYNSSYDSLNTEVLLYDFNLNLGDTLLPSYVNNGFLGAIHNHVTSIDSVLVGGNYRKRFGISNDTLQQPNYVYLIEGIGSTFGLLSPLFPPFEFGSWLHCFMIDSISVYSDSMFQCDIVTGAEKLNYEDEFEIYPNPAEDALTIFTNRNTKQNRRLEIKDILGREVMSFDKVKMTATEKSFTIDVSSLSKGIYFVEVQTEKGVINKKMIKN